MLVTGSRTHATDGSRTRSRGSVSSSYASHRPSGSNATAVTRCSHQCSRGAFGGTQAEDAIQRGHQAHRRVLQMMAANENAAVATNVTMTTVQPLARMRFGSNP